MIRKTAEVLSMCHTKFKAPSQAEKTAAESIYSFLIFRLRDEYVDFPQPLANKVLALEGH